MISYEKKCDICYHQKKMSCPSSEKCYSTIDKPYFVLGKVILNNRNAINPVPVISLEQFQKLKAKADNLDKLTTPLKPIAYPNGDFVCENCKTTIIDEAVWGRFEYCVNCGQRLDLSNV